jgi:hypothetical protein
VPNWPSFWDEVAMKAWWDLATLLICEKSQLDVRKICMRGATVRYVLCPSGFYTHNVYPVPEPVEMKERQSRIKI